MFNKFYFIIKLLCSIFLLIFCFTIVDYTLVLKNIYSQSFTYFFISSVLILLTLILASVRWKYICEALNVKMNLTEILHISLFSNFVGQILPGGGISGEITKVFLSFNKKNKKILVFKSVLYDKLFGLFVAFVFFLFSTIYFLFKFKGLIDERLMLIIPLIFLLCLIILIFYKKFNQKLRTLQKLNEIIKIPFKISEIVKFLVVSTLIYLLVLTCFIILCFQAIEVDVIVEIILCFPIIHFLKSFPLSVSGWGIREIVTVYLFSYFNLSNEIALSISISLGVIILVASFYGLIISIPLNLKLKYQRS